MRVFLVGISNKKRYIRPISSPKLSLSPMGNFISKNRLIQMRMNNLVVVTNHLLKQHLRKDLKLKLRLQMVII